MDLAEKLRQEAFSEHVAYTEFILKWKKNSGSLFCFFEGKDDNKYYGIRIENVSQRKFVQIICGGKDHVMKVKEIIEAKPEYRDIHCGYFIDMDYDSRPVLDNLYCLPSYSIENQYVTEAVLTKILNSEFSLLDTDPDYLKVMDYFEKLQGVFHQQVAFVNAWLACQSNKRKTLGIQTRLRIDRAIGHFFTSLVGNDLTVVSDLNDLRSLSSIRTFFPDAPKVMTKEVAEKLKERKELDPSLYNRGKFELRFFVSFLEKLKNEICKKSSKTFDKKSSCSLRFEYSTALTNLSIYANTPECLINYLSSKRSV